MNIRHMRKIDYYAGGTLCVLLEMVARIGKAIFGKSTEIGDVKTVLVTKYLGMGSILLATPMLKTLRAGFPDARLVFLTFDGNADFARQFPMIDEVISIRTSSFAVFFKDLLKILYRIRRVRFDVVLDLEFFSRFSTSLCYLSGARTRIGYYLPKLWRGNLLTHQVHFNPHRHVTEVLAAPLEPLGIKVRDFDLVPPVVKEAKVMRVSALLMEIGWRKDDSLIVINVNSSDLCLERRWPAECFARLIAQLVDHTEKVQIVMVGSGHDAPYVTSVWNMLPEAVRLKVVNLAGSLDIDEMIALFSMSSLLISNDSGPLHVAASLGIQTVSFFGPETPTFYGPVGSRNIVFYAGIYCSPCLNAYNAKMAMCNGDNRCMKEIQPSDVISVLRERKIMR